MSIYLGTERLATNIAGTDALFDSITETAQVEVATVTIANGSGQVISLSPVDLLLLSVGDAFVNNGITHYINQIFTSLDIATITPSLEEIIPSGVTVDFFRPSFTTISSLLVLPALPSDGRTVEVDGIYSSGGFLRRAGEDTHTFNLMVDDDGSTESPDIILQRNSDSPAVGDELGGIRFEGTDGSGVDGFEFSEIWTEIVNITDGAEEGALFIDVAHDGQRAQTNDAGGVYRFGADGMSIQHRTGTLASPPANLIIGEVWADTTTSTQYPILRTRTS